MNSGIDFEEVKNSINQINEVIQPLKRRALTYDRIILFYLSLGLLITSCISILVGVEVHAILSLIVAFIYLIGLVFLIKKIKILNQ